jgi:16S rRNA processing protein RimM
MVEKFVIGLVGAPFGIKGFVKVHPCSGEIDHLLKLESVILKKDDKELLLNVEESTPASRIVLIRFEGIDNPEKAKTLNGAQLLAGREQAAPLAKGEFYIEDLKGLSVIYKDNEIIGHVKDVIEGGGGDLIEIKLLNNSIKLVPFRKEFFGKINIKKGKLTLQNLWILE